MICFSRNHNWTNTPDVTEAERYFIVVVELSNSPAKPAIETVQTLPLSISTCSPRTLSVVISQWRFMHIRGPKGWKGLTLESLFFSTAELLREKRRVRLRLLAEFLERLELLHWEGRSGTRQHQSNISPENNGAQATGIQYQTNISTPMKYSLLVYY